jgi:hypothetical protein
VRLSPLGTSATVGLLYQPRMIDDHYGAVGGMRIGRGNRSTRRKPAPVPLCPPQIPHDPTWDRTSSQTSVQGTKLPLYYMLSKIRHNLLYRAWTVRGHVYAVNTWECECVYTWQRHKFWPKTDPSPRQKGLMDLGLARLAACLAYSATLKM